jgi:hypothetical protein
MTYIEKMGLRKVAGSILLAAGILVAQENAPPGFLHGGLVSWTGTPREGQFMFQVSTGQSYFCSYDERTYIERENRRISMTGMDPGDRLAIVSDRKSNSTVCYARTIQVLEDQRAQVAPGVRPRLRANAATPVAWPHSYLTVSGAVSRITSDLLILRSPSGERTTIRLGPATRYLCGGQTADAASLGVNTVVFIRASRNFRDEMEADQVIWGGILQPGQ